MAHEPTEDITGDIDPFAIEDEEVTNTGEDELTPQDQLVVALRKYLDEAIVEHNSFDIIDLTEQAKMTPTQQIAVHKLVVQHLRNIKQTISDKVKEN